jgi:hypothetical protein
MVSALEERVVEPIAYVARLNELYKSQGFPPYQWSVYESAPLTLLSKPLAHCRVALLTSGGVSRKDAAPFNPQARAAVLLLVQGCSGSSFRRNPGP